jgi:hypothetical protein
MSEVTALYGLHHRIGAKVAIFGNCSEHSIKAHEIVGGAIRHSDYPTGNS